MLADFYWCHSKFSMWQHHYLNLEAIFPQVKQGKTAKYLWCVWLNDPKWLIILDPLSLLKQQHLYLSSVNWKNGSQWGHCWVPEPQVSLNQNFWGTSISVLRSLLKVFRFALVSEVTLSFQLEFLTIHGITFFIQICGLDPF